MKKLFQLTLVVLALLLPATALAYDFEVDGIYYNINGNEATVTYPSRGLSYSGDVAIPESIVYNDVTYPVTAIGNLAFDSYSGVTSVSIPNSINSIGNYAFGDCTGLTSIDIPNSVTSIGSYAFDGCTGLINMTIPYSVTTIGNNPFMHCTNLTNLNVDPDNSNYDSRNNCNAIIETATNTLITGCSSTVIPNTVTAIGNSAFYGCSGLKNVSIPSSITSIGSHVFADCSGLMNMSVDPTNPVFDSRDNCNAIIEKASNTLIAGCSSTIIPNTVIAIGSDAFYRCSGLTNIDIPNSVISIGTYAFYRCSGLTGIDIPNSVTSIGANAFNWCLGLTNVSISNSVTAISERTFFNCTGLTSVSIPNSVITIGDRAFLNCSGLTSINIPNSVTTIGERAFESCTGLTAIIIPKSVTSIGSCAFASCSSLASASIPSSVTSIGGYAFSYCDKLNVVYSFIVDPSQITMGDGVFYCVSGDYSTRTLYVASNIWRYQNDSRWSQYFDNIQTSRFEVDGICYQMTNIDEVCVAYGGNYTGEVIIPETITYNGVTYPVTAIGEMAFYSCHELSSVIIPNSVTTIGREAFEGSGLTSIVIPNSVTFLGEGSFRETGLTSVVIPGNVKTIGEKAFMRCENLTDVTLSEGLIFIDEEAFSECGITEIHLPESLVRIGEQAFEETPLTSITIPKNVAYLGNEEEYENDLYGGVFDYCYQLMEVNVDLANATYASYNGMLLTKDMKTFLYCPGGRSGQCVIPNSVTTIGGGWRGFDCQGLTSVIIPSKVEYINDEAFYGCNALTLVKIFAVNQPSVGRYPFSYYSFDYITLEVPAQSVEAYRTHEYWGQFQNIQPIVQTSGDVDGDGQIGIGDVANLIDLLLGGNVSLDDCPTADVDGDGRVTIADVSNLIDMLLKGNNH